MSRKERLLALAKRCEEAAGPDRYLDVAIWEAIFGGTDNYLSLIKRSGDWFVRYYPSPPGPEYYRLKSYTGSLDAAVTLVPVNAYWEICGDSSAVVMTELDCDHTAFANSPPLAICAAALLAHADETVE